MGPGRLMCHVYRWDRSPSPFDLWDPTLAIRYKSLRSVLLHLTCGTRIAYVSRVRVGPFSILTRGTVGPLSISIRPVGPDDLRVT
jgi:hypothetical protein